MKKKKLSDASQVVIGIAMTLAVWAIGIYMSGVIPWIADFVRVSDGNALLCKLYPVFLIAYSLVLAVVCKRKSKDALFFGSYLLLVIPAASFVIIQINSLLNYEFQDYIFLIIMLFFTLAAPAVSAFNGFFDAVYGNVQPVGFTVVHLAFCIIMIVVAALPPIVYMLVKSKQISE